MRVAKSENLNSVKVKWPKKKEKQKKGRAEKRQERYKIFIYMSFARATCNPERPLCQVLLLLFAALVIVVTVVVFVVIVVAG